jgi:molecular chaperone GrpE
MAKHKEKTEELNSKISELTNTLQRLQAEFENYRKRTEEEKKSIKHVHNQIVFHKLIPIIDNFEEALKHSCTDKNYEIGMKMIHAALVELLTNEGVTISDPVDEPFNAEIHEAISTESDKEKKENTILKTLKKGYILNGKPIRRAKVIVNKIEQPTEE